MSIPENLFGLNISTWRGIPTILGVNFGGEFWRGAPENWRNTAQNFAGSIAEEFAEKFAGNSPKVRQTELKNSTQICSAEPRDQHLQNGTPAPTDKRRNMEEKMGKV